jgi:hypothetical protein
MTFKYDYIPLDQLETDKPKHVVLADGEATFKIKDVWETNKDGSQRTNSDGITPKITIVLVCHDRTGKEGLVYHDISAKMQWAIVALGDAIGRNLYHESGYTNWKEIIGCHGKCTLEAKSSPGYDTRSTIKKYVPWPTTETVKEPMDSDPF